MGVDPDRLCDCTIWCTRSKVESSRLGIVCRYRNGQVKPDSYFLPGGDPTPRRQFYEKAEAEVVPRSVAEALAEALKQIASATDEQEAALLSLRALAEYRTAYPKETP